MAEPRIADDYSFIAQRLREVEAEKGVRQPIPEPKAAECYECLDGGWVPTDQSTSGWKRCHSCNKSYDISRPPIRPGRR